MSTDRARPTQKLKISWNKLHLQSRQEFCSGACISEHLAGKSWNELDKWLQVLLVDSIERRTKGKVQLCA